MPRPSILLLLCLAMVLRAGEPRADAGQQELHGTVAGQPFWMRLLPPDKQFGDNRILQLVHTPPAASDLEGAHVSDCPFLLLDPLLRIVAWNGRDTGSKAVPAAPSGYAITREVSEGTGDDQGIALKPRTISGERGWDLRTAPMLLALGWRRGTSATIRLIDLFGPRHAEALTLTWNDTAVTIAGNAGTITPDEHGRLKTLVNADGIILLSVAARSGAAVVP